MRRKVELIVGLIMLIGLIVVAGKLSNYVSSPQVTKEDIEVILDAGHGGWDPGKVGLSGSVEKDINLAISKKLEAKLKKKGIKLIVTRKDNNGLYSEDSNNKKAEDMKKRVNLINMTKPALTVSIHQNSFSDQRVKGPQVFYYTSSKKSKEVAELLQKFLNKMEPNNAREAKANNTYYMLKRTEVPTVIVECGFLSSPEDEAKLLDEKYQEKVAKTLCDGIIESLALLED